MASLMDATAAHPQLDLRFLSRAVEQAAEALYIVRSGGDATLLDLTLTQLARCYDVAARIKPQVNLIPLVPRAGWTVRKQHAQLAIFKVSALQYLTFESLKQACCTGKMATLEDLQFVLSPSDQQCILLAAISSARPSDLQPITMRSLPATTHDGIALACFRGRTLPWHCGYCREWKRCFKSDATLHSSCMGPCYGQKPATNILLK